MVVQNPQLRTPEATPEPPAEQHQEQPEQQYSTGEIESSTNQSETSERTQEPPSRTISTSLNPPSNEPSQQNRGRKGNKQWIDLKGPAPRQIKGDVGKANEIEGKRVRKRSQFAANFSSIDENSFFYTTFITIIESYART